MQSVSQTNLIPVSSLHVQPAPAKDHIFSTAGKNSKQGQTQPNPVQHPMEWTVRKKCKNSEWSTESSKKTKHRIGKGDSGTLKAAQKPVVLFISHVDPDTTQEEVEKFANIHFQKTEAHCKKLKTRYTFMPLSKLPFKVSKWKMPSAYTYGPVAY